MASAKLDVREAPFFDELLTQGKKLWRKMISCRRTKRNLMWKLAHLVVQADEHEGGSKYGKEWIKTYAKEVGIHYNWLYDALKWYRIDPAGQVRETQISTNVENVSFSRVRKIVAKVETPDQLKSLLDDHPDLDTLPGTAFEMALEAWHRKYFGILSNEGGNGNDSGDGDDGSNGKEGGEGNEGGDGDDGSNGDESDSGTDGSNGGEGGEEQDTLPPESPREPHKDYAYNAETVISALTGLKSYDPDLYDLCEITRAEDGETFSIQFKYLGAGQFWSICDFFARNLQSEEGE